MPSPSQRTEPWQFPGWQEVRKPLREKAPQERRKPTNVEKPNKDFPKWAQ